MYHVWADPLEGTTVFDLHRENELIRGTCKNRIPVTGLLHDPVTYDGISHPEMQVIHSGTFNKKPSQATLVLVFFILMSHCATCVSAWLILYHVTGSCEGSISIWTSSIKNSNKK